MDEFTDETIYEPTVYNPQSTKHDIQNAGFETFLQVWNSLNNHATPDIHRQMAKWLEYAWLKGDRRLLLMAFRSAGKSTLVGVFAAWLLYRDSNLRILVLAADHRLAIKMVNNVKRIIEKHTLTDNLKPDNASEWAADRFTVKRSMELRDPSMLAKGITSNITGSRADIIICDDVEVPNTSDSADKREELRERLKEIEYVLTADGTQLYVGTPHHYHTIYAKEPRIELGEDNEFLRGFKRLEIPVIDQNGESAWLEKYSAADIKRIKTVTGPNKFASQMMLEPRNITEGSLNIKALQFYDGQLDFAKEINTLLVGKIKMISASAFWDPAFGSKNGDNSVVAIIYTDQDGNYYLHNVSYIKINELDKLDEASQQCQQVAKIAKDHYLPSITVEINGIGRFLPKMLRAAMAKAYAPCSVQELHQNQNKENRIAEAFDAILAAKRLFVHKSVFKTPFMNEIQEWQHKANKGNDDGVDAVASALAQCPDRTETIFNKGAHNWMRGRRQHNADTNFKI